jgi:hypothetical protein
LFFSDLTGYRVSRFAKIRFSVSVKACISDSRLSFVVEKQANQPINDQAETH